MNIQIIAPDNGAGLSRDISILSNWLIQEGHNIIIYNTLQRKVPDVRDSADINIHLEVPEPSLMRYAGANYLIPNPEWFKPNFTASLKSFTGILCKTQDAFKIFGKLHHNVRFISFTSVDRCDMDQPRKRAFLHSPGKSSAKGTLQVIDCWKIYFNDLPEVNIVQWENNKNPRHPNVNYIFGKVKDDQYKAIQNQCIFHLCPSSYEGFGHYYWEALSCGGIVVTTDAAPMNELITEDIGILVPPTTTTTQNLGKLYHVSPIDLYYAAKKCVEMDQKELHRRSILSRNLWLTNDSYFRREIIKALEL